MSIARSARLDLRLRAGQKARIELAAKMTRESLSSFVVRAAVAQADRVLARAEAVLTKVTIPDEVDPVAMMLEMREHER